MSAVDVLAVPQVPAIEPGDWRVTSESVVIRTVQGEWYTARWVEYQDSDGYEPCWELIGRDGLQLEREAVTLWFSPDAVAELMEAAGEYTAAEDQWDDDEEPETSEAAKARNAHVRRWKRVYAALARCKGEL